jgi:hypothetical protein
MSGPPQQSARRPVDWLEQGFLLALLLACAIALAPNNVDPDLWGHVQYAEDALADGQLHGTATHTFTAVGHPWINHENLSEVWLAGAYRTLGAHGMLGLKCLLGLGVVVLMLRSAARQGVSLIVAGCFLLLVSTTLTPFWAMRPQLSSYVLLALMIVLLDRAFQRWQDEGRVELRLLWLIIPLLAVWTNSHGAFVAGVCLFIAYLGCRSLEAIWRRGWSAWPVVAHFSLLVLAALLATFANPYGWDLHLWLAESLRVPRPEISEWAAPKPSDPFFFPMIALVLVTVASWAATSRRRDWTHIVLVSLCIWQAASHSRHIALFAITAGFWLPVHVESLVAWLRRGAAGVESETEPSPRARRALAVALAVALVLLTGRLAMRLWDFPVERDQYPVDALEFMAEHDLSGRLVVSFNWAQYALAALSPDTQVAFDGRFRTCYPQQVIDMHFDFLIGDVPGHRYRSDDSGEIDPQRVLQYEQPDLVLVDRRFGRSVRAMESQDAFVLLYQDGLAQVWGRGDVFDDPASSRYLAAARREIGDEEPTGSVTWPALPNRERGERKAESGTRHVRFPITESDSIVSF